MSTSRKVGTEAGKGLLLAGFLALVMVWLSGAFLDKVSPAPAAPEGKPPAVKTARVERRAVCASRSRRRPASC